MVCGNITFLVIGKCAKFNPQILAYHPRSLAHKTVFYLFLIATILHLEQQLKATQFYSFYLCSIQELHYYLLVESIFQF
jgi:hypothetical protein